MSKPARLVESKRFATPQALNAPFSSFDYVEDRFGPVVSIRRLFSLSRSRGGKTLLTEDISPDAAISAENRDIARQHPGYKMGGLKRLTFWKTRIRTESELSSLSPNDLLGYAILKNDCCVPIGGKDSSRWHVFESVFRSFDDRHIYIPCKKKFSVTVGSKDPQNFHVTGPMYCEQNGLNKACAQVALRGLCCSYLRREPTFSEIHDLALAENGKAFNPAGGLGTPQIRAVLEGLKIGYTDISYGRSKARRRDLPFQKFVYSGIESGAGALLGFRFDDKGKGRKHLIPLVGHTFNRDQWVPHSDSAYFHLGNTRYISSEAWVGGFIGHDDSFGPNLSIPRFYLNAANVEYVVTLTPKGVLHDGPTAEAIASFYLYQVLGSLDKTNSRWFDRLIEYSGRGEVVLRALPMTKKEYVAHLAGLTDWKRRKEKSDITRYIDRYTKKYTWMVEISAPGLFPINNRKLGEILLDATYPNYDALDYSNFVFARFPGQFLFFHHMDRQTPVFSSVPSRLTSHTPVYTD